MKRYIPKTQHLPKRSYEPKRSEPKQSYEPKSKAITPAEYDGWQTAFEHLNATLFAGSLSNPFFTYQRKANSNGYFGANRFTDRNGKGGQHEIALNPDNFVDRSDEQIVSTLLHEMAHEWQFEFGKQRARSSYHDRQWAAKMIELGLQPSSTGKPGGKITGSRMTHYIIKDGAYRRAFTTLAATGWKLHLESARRPGSERDKKGKPKVTCDVCGQNAWGKPSTSVDCHACKAHYLHLAGFTETQIEAIMAAIPPMRVEGTAPPVTSYDQDGIKSYEQQTEAAMM